MPARILLADDDTTVLSLVRHAIEAEGLEVAGEARDGTEALALARSLRPDVLVIDLSMPGLDGLEVIATIGPELPNCAVVVFSAADGHARTGVDRYVDKSEGFPAVARAVVELSARS